MNARELRRRIYQLEGEVNPEELAAAVHELMAGKTADEVDADEDVLRLAVALVADLDAIDRLDGRR